MCRQIRFSKVTVKISVKVNKQNNNVLITLSAVPLVLGCLVRFIRHHSFIFL